MTRGFAQHWLLDETVTFLNHGSFGACPRPVLEAQTGWRQRMEKEPVRFLGTELESLLQQVRQDLGTFLGASPDHLALLPNATSGVNTVLRSLPYGPGDEILMTDHEYEACAQAVRFLTRQRGARCVVAHLPFPLASPQQVVDAVLAKTSKKTRLLLLDHVTSQTGLVLPVKQLVREMRDRDIETLVDGAHAPGMVDLDLDALGAAFYTGNCHKWLCAPKGAAFLHVREDCQAAIHPLCLSHGTFGPAPEQTVFRQEFDWTGTYDPTPHLAIPAALKFMGSLLPGGWDELRDTNRTLALEGRDILCAALEMPPPAPAEMIGSLASVPLTDGQPGPPPSALYQDPLQQALLKQHGIQIPVIPWPAAPQRLIRISAQIYNHAAQYRQLAAALKNLLP